MVRSLEDLAEAAVTETEYDTLVEILREVGTYETGEMTDEAIAAGEISHMLTRMLDGMEPPE